MLVSLASPRGEAADGLLETGLERRVSGVLTVVGFGVELDTESTWEPVGRTGLVGRYVLGANVSGFSVGFGVSF